MGFYANHGFLPDGPIFDDAGIPHRTMTLTGDPEKTLMPLDAESLRFDTPTLLVAIEPQITDGEMRINLLRLSDDEASWLTQGFAAMPPHMVHRHSFLRSLRVKSVFLSILQSVSHAPSRTNNRLANHSLNPHPGHLWAVFTASIVWLDLNHLKHFGDTGAWAATIIFFTFLWRPSSGN